ncbi:MAG: glucosyl-3-phosphoglycerate synthase [Armatimonadota bacterium]|nr:glucosyl-3-phosphoglycerate synthase [Armatimonadota bacterium]MDR5696133.1 glucosyl-3-phosphoglycerate synthase [Armatimonadota bacterium]
MTRPILLPLADLHQARAATEVGRRFARAWQAPLLLLYTVAVPPPAPLSQGAIEAQRARERLEAAAAEASDVRVHPLVRVGREPWEEVVAACLEHDAALLVLLEDGAERSHLFERTVDFVLHHPPCDLVLMPAMPPEAFHRILVGVRGGPNAELALRVATALAQPEGGEVTGLHVFRDDIPERDRWREERPYIAVMEHAEGTVRKRIAAGSAADVIARESAGYTAVVVGATADPQRPAIQPAFRRIRPLIVVSSAQPVEAWMARQARLPSRWSLPEVEKWFAENTFHAREFADLDRLLALKEQRGVTISLGLPALNEQETIGQIIRVLRDALMREVPLLDEIALIDSDSTDRTREIAHDEGVSVYRHAQILPQYGTYRGKGEALWKSLYVLRGDIVVWVDTDIRNMHPKFVYGLIGPLLREGRIQFVKGYYRRPVQVGGRMYETGGGRVTELTARPLLNLFFPELSGLIQPLAGEYAGRREVLEQIPFFTGYGVETGMLIDILTRFGLGAIGQVDLEQRIHRNQSLQTLSMMSFQIVQVVMRRLEDRLSVPFLGDATRTMKLIRSAEGQLALEEREVVEWERPPMVTLPEYRARRSELARQRALSSSR